MTTQPAFDFAYPWWLANGHLVILLPVLAAVAAAWLRHWPRWLMALLCLLATWAAASLFLLHALGMNTPPPLPTNAFFPSGQGRILDLGAGTGRSAIMALRARPHAELVALDLFAESFTRHFGPSQNPRELLQRNLDAAGLSSRVSIVTADMRRLPFPDASFDALLSAYAVDHLPRQGSVQTLREAHRVLKPGGHFLLILAANDARLRFAFGPLLLHRGLRPASWWRTQAEQAGFRVLEQGNAPISLYFLLHRN